MALILGMELEICFSQVFAENFNFGHFLAEVLLILIVYQLFCNKYTRKTPETKVQCCWKIFTNFRKNMSSQYGHKVHDKTQKATTAAMLSDIFQF